jgi:HlyD family secretion protein
VKVALTDPDERLRPGMTSQVDIITDEAKSVLSVPVQSVVERSPDEVGRKSRRARKDADAPEKPKKKYVLVVRDGKAHLAEVAPGISDTTHVAIAAGLKGDEQVVTGPFRVLKKLGDGDAVQPKKEADREARGDEEENDEDESKQ